MKKFTRLMILLTLVAVMVAAMMVPASACFTVLVGKDASATGQVMVTHNEDDGGRAMVWHGYVPPQDWPEGTVLPAEPGRAAIPQVSHTLGYYWSQLKPAAGGYSNADGYYNDAGVLIVSNSNASSKITDALDPNRLTDGGIEYNLRRVLAERATSAKHGVEICIEMIETYGYAPSGRAYTIADKNEAWNIQIVSGKNYVAARCPDDGVVVMPNHITIHDLNMEGYVRGVNIFYPDTLIDYAKEHGIYEETNGVFDYAKSYQHSNTWRVNGNTYRQFYGTQLLLTGEMPDTRPDDAEYPFFVRVPDGSISLERLMAVQSEHYEGTTEDAATPRAPGGNPHDTTLRRICTGTTDESLIAVFEEEPMLTTLWTSFGHPCELPYIPLHPLAGIPTEIDQMEDPNYEMETHLLPDPNRADYDFSGWNEFRDIQMKMDLTHKDNANRIAGVNAAIVARTKAANHTAIADAKADPENAAAILAAAGQKATTDTLNTLKGFVEDEINEVTVAETVIELFDTEAIVDITFTAPKGGAPVEETMVFGLGLLNTRTAFVKVVPGTLVNNDDGTYTVGVAMTDLIARFARYTVSDGIYEFFLGGETETGKCFVGMALNQVDLAKEAIVEMTGLEAVRVDDELTYSVTVDNVDALATITVEIAIDVEPEVVPAPGWSTLATEYTDGIYTVVMFNYEGLTTDEPTEMFSLFVPNPGTVGDFTAELLEATLSAYIGEEEGYLLVTYGQTVVTTEISYSLFDVNLDGIVNQLDLTRAQRYYGSDDAICDVDGSGEVDVNDIIMILNYYNA